MSTTDNTTYFVARSSNTAADTLLAVGFASLMQKVLEALGREHRGIRIRNGPYYEIRLPEPLTASDLRDLRHVVLVQPLMTEKQVLKLQEKGQTLVGFAYEEQQAQRGAYREALKELPPELSRPEARLEKDAQLQAIAHLKPSPELVCYQAINQMRISPSFNELALRWAALTPEQTSVHVALLLSLFRQPHNDVDAAVEFWQRYAREYGLAGKAYSTALQIVNPAQGKGANRSKAGELSIHNQDSFWLLELLKFAGFMLAAAPFTIQNITDRKIYVLQPEQIGLDTLQETMRDFRDVCWSSTDVKMDIMAVMRFAQVYVEYRRRALASGEEGPPRGGDAAPDLPVAVQSFEVTYYKDMGQAYAVMNMSTLGLPAWLPPLSTHAQANEARDLLAEHVRIIQQVRNNRGEEGSDEYALLRHYRDFLAGRNLPALWAFTEGYSRYLMSQRMKRASFPQFDQLAMEELIIMVSTMRPPRGQPPLAVMIGNQGFQHVVRAIRHMTVNAQYRQRQGSRTYDVHYQLGADLMRAAAQGRDAFMAKLNHYMFLYNQETARVAEKHDKLIETKLSRKVSKEDRQAAMLRSPLEDTDLLEVIALIEVYGALLVGSTLVALGYAREHRVKGDAAAGAEEELVGGSDLDPALESNTAFENEA